MIKILLDVIEKYRAENQDPVLRIASGFFKKITMESFHGLRTDMDDQGKAILIGVRPDGSWVKVEGMSVGTRDQLYLALRLATLEWRLSFSEPMPFIVDDILINFDDDRSGATLEALADWLKKIRLSFLPITGGWSKSPGLCRLGEMRASMRSENVLNRLIGWVDE